MDMEINGSVIRVELEDNSSVQELKELLRKGSLTLEMNDFAHMENFANLGVALPKNDETITVMPGDVILSEGCLLVIYYASNTWNFTRLGKALDLSQDELRKILGKGRVTAVLTLGEAV